MKGWILGVNIGLHDASAALVKDGQLVIFAEQEKISQKKRANGESPADCISWCLNSQGLSPSDLQVVALGTDLARLIEWSNPSDNELELIRSLEDPNRLFPDYAGRLPPIVRYPHHVAHAASAFRVSGYPHAAVLVIDNRGEDSSASLFDGRDGKLTELHTVPVENSLGLYYRAAADYAGLCGAAREVGKFMGLASYGSSYLATPLKINDDCFPHFPELPLPAEYNNSELARIRTDQLRAYFEEKCFPHASGLEHDVFSYAHFAFSVQKSLEAAILGLCRKLKAETKADRLCLAGGVALNCTANRRIRDADLFNDIFVTPVASDAGVALGAALLAAAERSEGSSEAPRMEHALYGPTFSQQEVETDLSALGLDWDVFDGLVLYEKIAGLLADGAIVGWFQGAAEIGPRALGARSLIGDPRSRQTLERLNQIKGREMWRPVAPSVLAERQAEFFSNGRQLPFMLEAVEVLEDKRRVIPAVTHFDGTARPHSVRKELQPHYWGVINQFAELTGVPMVVNTSFNLAGNPIVHTPRHAAEAFVNSKIDVLVVGNSVVVK